MDKLNEHPPPLQRTRLAGHAHEEGAADLARQLLDGLLPIHVPTEPGLLKGGGGKRGEARRERRRELARDRITSAKKKTALLTSSRPIFLRSLSFPHSPSIPVALRPSLPPFTHLMLQQVPLLIEPRGLYGHVAIVARARVVLLVVVDAIGNHLKWNAKRGGRSESMRVRGLKWERGRESTKHENKQRISCFTYTSVGGVHDALFEVPSQRLRFLELCMDERKRR